MPMGWGKHIKLMVAPKVNKAEHSREYSDMHKNWTCTCIAHGAVHVLLTITTFMAYSTRCARTRHFSSRVKWLQIQWPWDDRFATSALEQFWTSRKCCSVWWVDIALSELRFQMTAVARAFRALYRGLVNHMNYAEVQPCLVCFH
jgi:hypothetical protein